MRGAACLGWMGSCLEGMAHRGAKKTIFWCPKVLLRLTVYGTHEDAPKRTHVIVFFGYFQGGGAIINPRVISYLSQLVIRKVTCNGHDNEDAKSPNGSQVQSGLTSRTARCSFRIRSFHSRTFQNWSSGYWDIATTKSSSKQ